MKIPQEIIDKYDLGEYEESAKWIKNFLDKTETEENAENETILALRTEAEALLIELTDYDTIIANLKQEKQELTEQLQLVTGALLEMADQFYE